MQQENEKAAPRPVPIQANTDEQQADSAQFQDRPDEVETAADQDWKARYEEIHEKYLRALADLQNYRRRASQEMVQRQQYANEDLLAQLLPVADNCSQALAGICQTDDTDCIIQGVEMILGQLHDFMQRHGVEQINPLGEQFSPEFHEAVEAVPDPQTPPNTIVEVVQYGYTLRDRLLRPAKVKVAVAPRENTGT